MTMFRYARVCARAAVTAIVAAAIHDVHVLLVHAAAAAGDLAHDFVVSLIVETARSHLAAFWE